MEIIKDKNNQPVRYGYYVKVLKRSPSLSFLDPEEEKIHQASIGRIARVTTLIDKDITDGLLNKDGELLVRFEHISSDGVQSVGLYVFPNEIEVVQATEEMLLLYSEDLWMLIRGFGEVQDTKTFKKLIETFGDYSIPLD